MECIEPEIQFTFDDRNHKLKVKTFTIRWTGKNKCGLRNIKIPHNNMDLNINSKQNTVIQTPKIFNNDDQK